ncbi:MAG: endonuclease/exonuclease/phosphatase family protein [Spirochaetales bacterium]|nr:endonuclease/exonuclease/phosphatase family protein [Spirochaetales bacterium]
MKKILIVLIITFTISSCDIPNPIASSDLNIVTANLLYSNTTPAGVITNELIELKADVYILHEASVILNVDSELFVSSGYSVHSFNESSHNAFNGVIASRLPAVFEYIDLAYSYGFDPVFLKPFYASRVIVDAVPITIIGAHIPPAIMMPEELKELRLKAFTEISAMIEDGKLLNTSSGAALRDDDLVIIAGDLNTFASDELLSPLISSGLADSILAGPNYYDFTWKPVNTAPFLARIDYIFHSKHFTAVNHRTHTISGSDHKAVQTWLNIK